MSEQEKENEKLYIITRQVIVKMTRESKLHCLICAKEGDILEFKFDISRGCHKRPIEITNKRTDMSSTVYQGNMFRSFKGITLREY